MVSGKVSGSCLEGVWNVSSVPTRTDLLGHWSDFEGLSQHQLFHSAVLLPNGVVQLSVSSECVHMPSSKLILTGMNTNYLAPSRGAQLCLISCFKAISSHALISINFCHI